MTEPADLADHHQLRRAFGMFATGVTVVTTGGAEPHGMTANSFASVSLDPPLVLVCVECHAVMHRALLDTGRFGVSVLASDQAPVARHFADRRRPLGARQFDVVEWKPGAYSGAPMLSGAVAHFECDVWRSYDGGDHTIFLGLLRRLDRQLDEDVLLFLGGQFLRLAGIPAAVSP